MTTYPVWRISSFSGSNGSCVAVAPIGDCVLVRNSNQPAAGTLSLSPASVAAFVAAAKNSEYDDLG